MYISIDIGLEVEELDHRVPICSAVLVSAKQFSKGVTLIRTHTSSVEELPLLQIFGTILYPLTFCYNHSFEWEVI